MRIGKNWKENLDARNEVIWRNSKLGSLFTKRKIDTILEVDDYGVESEHKASGLIEFLQSIRLDIWKSYCNFLQLWETANR